MPTIEQLANADEDQRWSAQRAQQVYEHLNAVGASGEVAALSVKLRLGTEEKVTSIRSRLDALIGKDKGRINVTNDGLVEVLDLPTTLTSLEALRSLPINGLNISGSAATDLEPLKGMPLVWLDISGTKVSTLEPLRNSGLRIIVAHGCESIADWSPLAGAPIREFYANNASLRDLRFLAGSPVEVLQHTRTGSEIRDLSPLQGAPLRILRIGGAEIRSLEPLRAAKLIDVEIGGPFDNLSPLKGQPLRYMRIGSRCTDFSPLQGAPIEKLEIVGARLGSCQPLLELPKLASLEISGEQRGLEILKNHPTLGFIKTSDEGYIPLPEFWLKYDMILAKEAEARRMQEDAQRIRDEIVQDRINQRIAKATVRADGRSDLDLSGLDLAKIPSLKGLRIGLLRASNNPIRDLDSLRGLDLTGVVLLECREVRDLTPLIGLPLTEVHIYHTSVEDLSPLRGMPLERVFVDGIPAADISPLLDLPKLREVMIPQTAKNIELLREKRQIERIGWEGDWSGEQVVGRPGLTAAEFWARWDRLKAARKK